MSACVLVQTCDRYRPFWEGFWHFMEKHWDFDIDVPIYFCNEEEESGAPDWCRRLKTGKGTFVQNLTYSLSSVEEDTVFLLLEDFWPIAPFKRKMFDALMSEFEGSGLDALQVSNYTPYYKIEPSGREVLGRPLMRFARDSDWIFNFQARFWRKSSILRCLVEPEISERQVGSAITAEMAADSVARNGLELNVCLFHYLWYPLSGVSYRGQMTEFGRHLENIVRIDKHVDELFSPPPASNTRPVCSA